MSRNKYIYETIIIIIIIVVIIRNIQTECVPEVC
jgi:hypothetical protein